MILEDFRPGSWYRDATGALYRYTGDGWEDATGRPVYPTPDWLESLCASPED